MCKRPCFDDDYLPTFNLPNVHLVDTNGKGITEITERARSSRARNTRSTC